VTLIVAALLVGLGVGLASGIFEDDGPAPEPPAEPAASSPEPEPANPEVEPDDSGVGRDLPRVEDDPEGVEPGPTGGAPSTGDERSAAAAARAYVESIDDRDGRAVCDRLEPGSLEELDLPAASCAAALERSFGRSSSRGLPVWRSSEMTNDVSAAIDGESARVVATVFTRYRDEREPTIEDDIIYLTRASGDWRVVKPSATLYRAVGIAEIPLDVLQPPGG
jgi:hypothetical protein